MKDLPFLILFSKEQQLLVVLDIHVTIYLLVINSYCDLLWKEIQIVIHSCKNKKVPQQDKTNLCNFGLLHFLREVIHLKLFGSYLFKTFPSFLCAHKVVKISHTHTQKTHNGGGRGGEGSLLQQRPAKEER